LISLELYYPCKVQSMNATDDYCLSFNLSLPRGRSLMTILLLPGGPLGPGLRVRLPLVSHPQTDRGCLFPLDFPRPTPCGWSTGFIAIPLTRGRKPSHRLRPAFARFRYLWWGFDTLPTVAGHTERTLRISPDCSFTCVYFPFSSWLTTYAAPPPHSSGDPDS